MSAQAVGFSTLLFLIIWNFAIFVSVVYEKIRGVNPVGIKLSSSLTLVFAIICQLSLTYLYVVSDYSILNVYQNSHHLKPFIYKLTGSFGSHEGSMLLLILVLASYTFAFAFLSKVEHKIKSNIIACQALIMLAFCCLAAFTSNPFESVSFGFIPKEGLGLNPILQDIGLTFHPPVLYSGYLGFSLVFSCAIGFLLSNKFDKGFAYAVKPWLGASFGLLTAGIGLGSWWAYRELGWGGYWFWDPVENVSLMPWICGLGLIHVIKVLQRENSAAAWSAFLSLLSFIMCLMGIFLVRSGVMTSVHSFAVDGARGSIIMCMLAVFGIASFLIFGLKFSKIQNPNQEQNSDTKSFISKKGLILLNNYIMMMFLFVVVLGTLYPLISNLFLDSSVSVGPSYYNLMLKFLVVPGVISIFYLHLKKKKVKSDKNSAISLFAHIGVIMLVVGVASSSYFGDVKELNMKVGDSTNLKGFDVKLDNVEYYSGEDFASRVGIISISKNDKEIARLKPEYRYYPIQDKPTNESSIKTSIFGDLYAVIGNKDERDFFAIRLYCKPFMWMIWAGCFIIFLSSLYMSVKSLYRQSL